MKKYIILLLTLFLLLPIKYKASTNTIDRNTLNNYGVNKHWEITENNKDNILNTNAVNADEKIYDYSDILTEEEEKEIYKKIIDFINHTKIDMVFVSVNLPYYEDSQNEEYAADFYDYNDFGIDFENYSGVLLLRNTYEEDPYFNIYTFGNAQLYFNYNRLETTLDDIYYSFVNKNYQNGINIFINNLRYYYDQGIPNDMNNYIVNKDGYLKRIYKIPYKTIITIDIIITSIIMLILIKKNKMVKQKLKTIDYLDKQSINYTKKIDTMTNSYVTSHTRESYSSSGHSGGGFSSHSGSSGGGHSSGGGRHG